MGSLNNINILNGIVQPIYLTTPNNLTLALGLYKLQRLYETRNDYIMAISTLMIIPMILMFIFV
jgi:ABC-type glycerol-3-phosphate transport system permease component